MEPLESTESFTALVDALALARDELTARDEVWATQMADTVTRAALLLVKLRAYSEIQDRMIDLQDLLMDRLRLERDHVMAILYAAVTDETAGPMQ